MQDAEIVKVLAEDVMVMESLRIQTLRGTIRNTEKSFIYGRKGIGIKLLNKAGHFRELEKREDNRRKQTVDTTSEES